MFLGHEASGVVAEAGSSVVVFGMGGVGLSSVMGTRLIGAWPAIAVDVLEPKL